MIGGTFTGSGQDAPTGSTRNAQPSTAHDAVRRTVSGQAWAAALFLLALVPPIAASLLLGLSHRAHLIPYAPVWAWMAALLALAATIRSTLQAANRTTSQISTDAPEAINRTPLRGTTGIGWLPPVLLGVLLLVPSAITLYLRLTLSPTPLRLAAAQTTLYAITLLTLLLAPQTASSE